MKKSKRNKKISVTTKFLHNKIKSKVKSKKLIVIITLMLNKCNREDTASTIAKKN